MAQKRMLDKKISLSEKVASLNEKGMLLYTWMIPHADDFGLLQGSPKTIKAMVVPMLDWKLEDIGNQLETMKKVGLLSHFQINEKIYYRIIDFEKNQTLKKDRQPQTILDIKLSEDKKESWQACERLILEATGIHLEDNGNQSLPEEKRREDNIREEKEKTPPLKNSINYLKQIPEEDLKEFSNSYLVDFKGIIKKAQDLVNYCEMHGKKYKDYKALLRNAISKDFGVREQKKGMSISEQIEQAQREGRIPKQ